VLGFWTQPNSTTPTAETVKMVEDSAAALAKRGAKVRRVPFPVDEKEARDIFCAVIMDDYSKFLNETVPQVGAANDPLMIHMRKLPEQFFDMHSKADIASLQQRLPTLREQISSSMAELDAVICPVQAFPALPHYSVGDVIFSDERGNHPYTQIYSHVYSLPKGTVRCSTMKH
jgi:Asp-tRNA(Asn)/Glu-tRNA(Gln) amidotransferase A subunit family amidase